MAKPNGETINGGKNPAENLLMTSRKDGGGYDVKDDSDDVSNDGTTEERLGWDKKAEYILSAVGYCVGLGNIWRFPYVCMRNGGGAFLIPFFLSLMLCALPLYFLESAMGQFNARSSYHVWNICPLFKGIGASMNLLSFYFLWYYSIILAWTLIYLGHSFMSPLPWTLCSEYWNSDNCVTPEGTLINSSSSPSPSPTNGSDWGNSAISTLINGTLNLTSGAGEMVVGTTTTTNITANATVQATQEFWTTKVLERSSGITDFDGVPWQLGLALIVANAFITVAVIKGIRSTGKVVYVTATLPYMLLTVILILGVTLPGSGDGMLFYIKPDFSKLAKSDAWIDGFIQVFYSLGPGWGPLITMSSYNKFNNNCMKDSIILALCCEGTSIFGGFAIFSILGHMAYLQGVAVDSFANSGAGLAFIVYPAAISYLPVPQLWGVLFFTMLFSLGLDTQFGSVETIMTTIVDLRIKLITKYRKTTTVVFMVITTLLSLVFASRAGIYVFSLVDWYIAAFSMMSQVALEAIVVAWVYGADRFCRDIELMIGRKPYPVFVICWKFVSPAVLLMVLGVTLVLFEPAKYGDYTFPPGAQAFGWILSIIPFTLIVICFVLELTKHDGPLRTRIQAACVPHPDWGPAPRDVREKYTYEIYSYDDNKDGDDSQCCGHVV